MDRYDGFTQFVAARGASMSRTAYVLTGADATAATLLARALAATARDWPRVQAGGNPETHVRAELVRAYTAPRAYDGDRFGLSARQWAIAVMSEHHHYSAAEVASALDCTEMTVRTNLRQVPSDALAARAASAGSYADGEAAVMAARRVRRRAAAIPLGLVVVLAAVSIAVVSGLNTERKLDPEPVRTPAVAALPALPAQVRDPEQQVVTLPTDRGVGRALIAYRSCPHTCATYLLLDGGTQYRLATPSLAPECCATWSAVERDLPFSLSPDGRWLATSTGDRVTIRDLTSSAMRQADRIDDVLAWSPGADFVIGDCRNGICRVDLRTGTVSPIDPRARGVDDTGRVMTAFPSLATSSISLQITDPDASAEISGDRVLHGNEEFSRLENGVNQVEVAFRAAGWYAAIAFDLNNGVPKALVLGNYTDGSIAGRTDLPVGAGQPFFIGLEATFPAQAAPAEPVVLFGVAPGGLVARSTLPARAEFTVAGQGLAAAGPATLRAP